MITIEHVIARTAFKIIIASAPIEGISSAEASGCIVDIGASERVITRCACEVLSVCQRRLRIKAEIGGGEVFNLRVMENYDLRAIAKIARCPLKLNIIANLR